VRQFDAAFDDEFQLGAISRNAPDRAEESGAGSPHAKRSAPLANPHPSRFS